MTHRTRPGRSLAAVLLLLLASAAGLSACGDCCDEPPPPPYYGYVYVSNLTVPPDAEFVMEFYLAPVGAAFGPNLLTGPLAPSSVQFLGTFGQAYYDAEAIMELTAPVDWLDVFVGEGLDTTFEIY